MREDGRIDSISLDIKYENDIAFTGLTIFQYAMCDIHATREWRGGGGVGAWQNYSTIAYLSVLA